MIRWTDLRLPPDVRYVGIARAAALAAASTTSLNSDRMDDLRTCVSEAVSNAVTAHLKAHIDADVLVRFGCDEDTMIIEIHDSGPGVAAAMAARPEPAPYEDLDEQIAGLTEGGYGLPVMRALADEVELVESTVFSGVLLRLRFAQPAQVDG